MEIVFDCETTITPYDGWKEGDSLLKKGVDKGNPSPYLPTNELVTIHYMEEGRTYTLDKDTLPHFQSVLDRCTLLIGFNIKFDLAWLLQCQFEYDKEIWDCALAEYLVKGGNIIQPSLDETAAMYNLGQKVDKVKEYWEAGINTDKIPLPILTEYGEHDVWLTKEIYERQSALDQFLPF